MKITKLITLAAGFSLALSASANAQFSVSGGGSAIPGSGSGGDALVAGDGGAVYDTTMAGLEATSTVAVANAVTSITSIDIDGLAHSWMGDTQATLEDPTGVQHLIWLRPGYLNTSNFGQSGDFDGGNYSFVGDGSGAALPTTSGSGGAAAGTYNQTFDSGGTTWVSGTNGIVNTPMNSITGPAGNWTLHLYDWGGGDSGSFTGWTLNGTDAPAGNTGSAYCFGDGTGAACPCSNVGSAGEGCANSTLAGAVLTGSGDATFSSDTLAFAVAGAPASVNGLLLRAANMVALPAGDGILCATGMSHRSQIQTTSVTGTDSFTDFSGAAFNTEAFVGAATNFQYYYRDVAHGTCTATFNFSNGWTVTYLP
jgi:hypothetical protein